MKQLFILSLIFSSSLASNTALARDPRPVRPKVLGAVREGGSATMDRIIASIDGEPISLRDYLRYLAIQSKAGNPNQPPPQLRDFIIELLIEREAKSAGISVSENDISAYVEEIKRQNNLDDAGFERLLNAQGFSRADYLTQVKRDIERNRFLGSRFRSKLAVSEEEIDRFIESNPQVKAGADSIHVYQIAVPNDGTVSGAKEKIDTIAQQINSGTDWEKAGDEWFLDLGMLKAADLLPELRDAVEKLSPGQSSPVIETAGSYVILRLVARTGKEGGVPQSEREKIRQQLLQAKLKSVADEFFTTELPKKYFVEIK